MCVSINIEKCFELIFLRFIVKLGGEVKRWEDVVMRTGVWSESNSAKAEE